jgi:glucokinase
MSDTLAAASWEHRIAPAVGRSLYLAIGAGVGGAVLDDGVPLDIARGTPGHLGHIDVSGNAADAPHTPGSGRGALEAYLGAPALRRAGVPIDDDDCFTHHAAKPALAALARGLRIMLVIYRPSEIVLMGGLGAKLAPVMPALDTAVRDQLSPAAPHTFVLRTARSNRFAAALGAALGVM